MPRRITWKRGWWRIMRRRRPIRRRIIAGPPCWRRLQAQFEDFPAAIEAYVHANAVRPDRTDLLVARATLQERLMRFADAAATYKRLYELSYRDPQWLEKVAELSARQGRTAEAVQTLEEARIANRPPRAENFFSVAATLESWNMVDQAVSYAQRGMDLAETEHPGVFDETAFPDLCAADGARSEKPKRHGTGWRNIPIFQWASAKPSTNTTRPKRSLASRCC